MESLLIDALDYAKIGLPVFPLAKLSKVPLKNSKGYLDATTDEEDIFIFFSEVEPLANIGISLIDTDYFVIDCDNHQEDQDGLKSLMELSEGKPLPDDVVTVKTPNGLHFWFKQPKNIKIKNQIGLKNGLDIIKNFIVAPPSRVKRKDETVGTYQVVNGALDSIGEAPVWLISAITSNQQPKQSNEINGLNYSNTGSTKKYTAILLEEIVQGVTESERNIWLTRYTGKLLSLGMNPKDAYHFIRVVNENFINPSLDDREVNTIFKSILKAESRKRGR
ncbi:bifunctional DNA primase/polymerase [Desemzia incerta]|uniref:bifunctional DNA primase/polymerase n=1 Tax=Desemzia incerta TaxID=82801 RepID=UPI003CFD698A